MSIDADFNAGLIDAEEAKKRTQELEAEAADLKSKHEFAEQLTRNWKTRHENLEKEYQTKTLDLFEQMDELNKEIERLESQPAKIEYREKIPDGYDSIEQAIASKRKEVKEREKELERIRQSREKEEKRLKAVELSIKSMGDEAADAGLKKSQVRGCLATVRTFAGQMLQYRSIVHNRVLYPGIESDFEDLRKVVTEAQSFLNEIASPHVTKDVTPDCTVIEYSEVNDV
jgi:chromosome segregation ATPase